MTKNDEKQEINIEQENIMLKAEVDRLRTLAGNRLMILRRLEQYANDNNALLVNLRNDFAEVQQPVVEKGESDE